MGELIEAMERRVLFDAGVVDPTFGVGGYETITPPPGQTITSEGFAVQPDAKVLVATQTQNNSNVAVSSQIRRLLIDGSLDSAFGAGGIVSLPASDEVSKILPEQNGKIVIVGSILGRLNPDGSLDKTFAAGKGIEPLGNLGASDASLQPNDGIILDAAQIVRFNSDGSRDMSFGTNGAAVLPTASSQFPVSTVGGIAADRSGRIVVSVSDFLPPDTPGFFNADYGVVRLLANGKPDASFGTGGLSIDPTSNLQAISFEFDGDDPGPVSVAPNGTIYQVENRDDSELGVLSNIAAYSNTGTSHSTGGGPFGNYSLRDATDQAVQPDGKLVVFAKNNGGGDPLISVFRFLPFSGTDGSALTLDSSFGNAYEGPPGETDISLLPGDDQGPVLPQHIALMNDGRILISGERPNEVGPAALTEVLRLTGDPTFTASGTLFSDPTGGGSPSVGETFLAGRDVYADLNNNGKLDPGEPETSTGADGSYTLEGLPAGPLIIRQILPTGERQSSPANGLGQHVLVSSTRATGADFRDTTKILVSGNVFNDANGNGKQDNGETGLAGWTVYADLNNDGIFEANENSKITDSHGNFSFVGLSAGTYIFRIVPPKGWHQTFPSNNFGQHVTLASGGVVQSVLFGAKKN